VVSIVCHYYRKKLHNKRLLKHRDLEKGKVEFSHTMIVRNF